MSVLNSERVYSKKIDLGVGYNSFTYKYEATKRRKKGREEKK